jgi:hypothetical protein
MLDSEEEEGTRRENGKEQSHICCQREAYHNWRTEWRERAISAATGKLTITGEHNGERERVCHICCHREAYHNWRAEWRE